MDHDRNVLFGVLAWQTGLVDRASLLEAMYDCSVGGRDLSEVLRGRGLLTEADCRWLTTAMERQLRRHGDNPKQTLAGLEGVDSLHRELDRAGVSPDGSTLAASDFLDVHARTRAEMRTIDQRHDLGFEVGPTDAPRGASAETGNDDAREQRFRVVRSHARGGLGEVFVAVDTELKRDVALKQILPKQAGNDTSRARFLLEAEITGNLEHPGVVPVYALGTRDDGCPYYAMRFIRGESLEDAIQAYHGAAHWDDGGEKALELRELLARFVAVCHTMEYAHSRGIIHRDIKPENIMLGKYGETLLVDWGLARPYRNIDANLDSGELDLEAVGAEPQVSQTAERPTQMGSVVGTPQFMSPEQASGRLDLMGPASDVYSLGATLYCLLTDRPPFASHDVRRVLAEVQDGTFPPPRQIKREVPKPLEAICLKAMQREPKQRYESARALAADIQRWLADEPVAAYQERTWERAQRWMRRHRTLTRASAVGILLIACLAAVAYVREAGLRADLQTALDQEAVARAEADAARSSAEAHARRAEEQGALALGTLKTVLFDIQVRLKNLPATHSVRRNMLDKVVDGLQQVTRSFESAPEADQTLVRARLDIGDVFLNTGTGEAAGALQLAEEQYRKAMTTAEKLRADPARREQAEIDLAAAYQRLGDVGMQRGQWTAGIDWLKKSLELREQIAARRRDDLKARGDLAASVQRLGLVHQLQDELPEAEKFYRRFLAINQELHAADAADPEHLRNLSVAHERLGDIAMRTGDAKQAEQAYRECLRLRRDLVERDTENATSRRDLSVTLDRLAELAQGRNEADAADKLLAESLELRKELFELDPDNMQTLRDLSVSYAQLGDAALHRNRNREAGEYFQFYLEIVEKLTRADPANVQYRRDLATAHDRRGQVAARLGDLRTAVDSARARTEILAELAGADPANAELLRELSIAQRERGDVENLVGDLAAARKAFDEYLALTRRRIAARPQEETLRRVEADAGFRAGAAALALSDLDAAEKLLGTATAAALRFAEAAPRDEAAWTTLANFESLALEIAWEVRDAPAAVKRARTLVEHLERLREIAPPAGRQPYDDWIQEAKTRLAACEAAEKATTEAGSTTAAPTEPELIDFRAAALLKQGNFAGARGEAERLAGLDPKSGSALWTAARRFARIHAAAPAKEREADALRCLELLERCRELRMFVSLERASRLEHGAEFAELWERDDFRKLLEKVRVESRPADTERIGNATT